MLSRSLRNIAHLSLFVLLALGMSARADTVGKINDPRAVYVFGEVNASMSKSVSVDLLRLEQEHPGMPMRIYINSGGGYYADGMAIIHVMQSLSSPIETVCVSQCDSMAALILAAGTPGMRSAHPKARMLLHQLTSDPPRGNITDLERELADLRSMQSEYTRLMASYTKKSTEEVSAALVAARKISAEEALSFGLVDKVIVLSN